MNPVLASGLDVLVAAPDNSNQGLRQEIERKRKDIKLPVC